MKYFISAEDVDPDPPVVWLTVVVPPLLIALHGMVGFKGHLLETQGKGELCG